MSSDDPRTWMWAEACALLDRAERVHRRFFEPDLSAGHATGWSPPVDIFETEREIRILVALPGVQARHFVIQIDGDTLIVTGHRPLPPMAPGTAIRRLEMPHGRFERRIRLGSGRWKLGRRDFADGCLSLSLEKLD